jgi:hypothetical protein
MVIRLHHAQDLSPSDLRFCAQFISRRGGRPFHSGWQCSFWREFAALLERECKRREGGGAPAPLAGNLTFDASARQLNELLELLRGLALDRANGGLRNQAKLLKEVAAAISSARARAAQEVRDLEALFPDLFERR